MKLAIDMSQFRNKWKVCASNIDQYHQIFKSGGILRVLDAGKYTEWLQEFGIPHTLRLG